MGRPDYIRNIGFVNRTFDEATPHRSSGMPKLDYGYECGGHLRLSCVKCHTAISASVSRKVITCPFCSIKIIG